MRVVVIAFLRLTGHAHPEARTSTPDHPGDGDDRLLADLAGVAEREVDVGIHLRLAHHLLEGVFVHLEPPYPAPVLRRLSCRRR